TAKSVLRFLKRELPLWKGMFLPQKGIPFTTLTLRATRLHSAIELLSSRDFTTSTRLHQVWRRQEIQRLNFESKIRPWENAPESETAPEMREISGKKVRIQVRDPKIVTVRGRFPHTPQ